MKNRILGGAKNGRFFCLHKWEVAEMVGPDWDIGLGIKILCKCTICGKMKNQSNYTIEEVPDHFIDPSITYS